MAEDDFDLRASIRDALESEGYRVVEAGNGREALHILVQRDVDVNLIVSDILMPEMSGPDLVRVLANYVGLSGIPVIFITAALPDPSRADRSRAVVARLQKPFGLSHLLDLVSETLGRLRHPRGATKSELSIERLGAYLRFLSRAIALARRACQEGDGPRAVAILDSVHELPRFLAGEEHASFASDYYELHVQPLVQRYPELKVLADECPSAS